VSEWVCAPMVRSIGGEWRSPIRPPPVVPPGGADTAAGRRSERRLRGLCARGMLFHEARRQRPLGRRGTLVVTVELPESAWAAHRADVDRIMASLRLTSPEPR